MKGGENLINLHKLELDGFPFFLNIIIKYLKMIIHILSLKRLSVEKHLKMLFKLENLEFIEF